MDIEWLISDKDARKIADFINLQSNTFITNRINRNINYHDLILTRDTILHFLLYSLFYPIQKPGTNSKIASFFQISPFPFQYKTIYNLPDVREYVFKILKKNGIIQDINKTPDYFANNFSLLESSNWTILDILNTKLFKKEDKQAEREIADYIDTMFKGFGAIEARVFLQTLGLTKFEIPIDSVVSDWLNNFGFPVKLSTTALQDRSYYHFISDGIQLLCKKATVYPCVLEAAIHSDILKNSTTYK